MTETPQVTSPRSSAKRGFGSRATTMLLVAAAVASLLLAGCAGVNTQSDELGSAVPTPGTNQPTSPSHLPPGPAYAVGMGDSYMSGEAGQWATNTTTWTTLAGWSLGTPAQVYGNTAVTATGSDRGCHRSGSAPMNFPASFNLRAMNLACSGALTYTESSVPGTPNLFRPGVDFYPNRAATTGLGSGPIGQAQMLYEFAKTNRVAVITLSTGGDNAGFADVIQSCLKAFAELVSTCSGLQSNQDRISPAALQTLTTDVSGAFQNIQAAMAAAGYSVNDYRIVYQLPPMPIPEGTDMRYWQVPNRQTTGGCGFWNSDISWVLGSFAPALSQAFIDGARLGSQSGQNVAVVDNTELFEGHKLCENGATRTDDGTGSPPPTSSPDTFSTTEWVRGISVIQAEEAFTDQSTVGMHPMYWGQRALAGCAAATTTQMPSTPAFSQYTCALANPAYLVGGEPVVMVN